MTADLWKELHINALQFKGRNNTAFLFEFRRKLLKITGECGCKNFWDQWTRANPPNYASPEAYFEWTVNVHNAVNTKLNKPTFTVEQARELYSQMINPDLIPTITPVDNPMMGPQ